MKGAANRKQVVQITLGLGRTIGGGEYTALVIGELFKEIGFKLTLLAKRVPDPRKYLEAFNIHLPFDEVAIFRYPKLPKVFRLYHHLFYPISTPNLQADLYFNTSADSHPFAVPISAILNNKPIVYYITALPLTPPWHVKNSINLDRIISRGRQLYKGLFIYLARKYWQRMNTLFIVCSKYVANIVEKCSGVKSEILYTPVDIENYLWNGERKEDFAVVMGRLVPSKRYEDAILACKKTGVELVMLVAKQDEEYYRRLVELVKREGLIDRVKIVLNAPIELRSNILKRAKVFIHCRPEAGAKAVREAMAAGCIPVVPTEGGQSEFVPKEFTYSTLDELPQKIIDAMSVRDEIRHYMVEDSKKHSKQFFKKRLKEILINNGVI